MAPLIGEHVRLSLNHLMLEVLAREYSQYRMVENYTNPRSIVSARELEIVVDRVGLLPESRWQPKLDIASNAEHLNTVRAELDALLQENQKQHGLKVSKIQMRTFEEKVRTRLRNLVGQPPSEFEWRGMTIDPQTYASRYLPFNLGKHFRPFTLMRRKAVGLRNGKWILADRDFDPSALDTVIEQLAIGQPLLGTLRIENRFTDDATGVISTKFVEPSASDRQQIHKVVWVGFELDDGGNLVGLFFQNSWGDRGGPTGLYEVLADYIELHHKDFRFQMRRDRGAR